MRSCTVLLLVLLLAYTSSETTFLYIYVVVSPHTLYAIEETTKSAQSPTTASVHQGAPQILSHYAAFYFSPITTTIITNKNSIASSYYYFIRAIFLLRRSFVHSQRRLRNKKKEGFRNRERLLASKMSPKCLQNVSKMSPKCLNAFRHHNLPFTTFYCFLFFYTITTVLLHALPTELQGIII